MAAWWFRLALDFWTGEIQLTLKSRCRFLQGESNTCVTAGADVKQLKQSGGSCCCGGDWGAEDIISVRRGNGEESFPNILKSFF